MVDKERLQQQRANAGPSTPLRFAQDDTFFFIGHETEIGVRLENAGPSTTSVRLAFGSLRGSAQDDTFLTIAEVRAFGDWRFDPALCSPLSITLLDLLRSWDVCGIVRAGGDEVVDVFEGVDASASSDGGAVEGGGGAGELELAVEGPVLEERVDEAGVEDVAGAGGVDYGDAEGGDVEEMVAVEGEDSFGAEGGGGEAGVVAAVQSAEGLLESGFGGEAGGEVAADDEVVDVFH